MQKKNMAKKSDDTKVWCCGCNSKTWAIFFIIVGGYFLLTGLGIIPSSFPFWALLILVYGIYILMKQKK